MKEIEIRTFLVIIPIFDFYFKNLIIIFLAKFVAVFALYF